MSNELEKMASKGLAPLPDGVKQSGRPVVVYEQAVRAVRSCSTILEAKHWSDKSEALAAWAKIYADDRVLREAKALKLHAYRQIGRLAEQIKPMQYKGRGGVTGPNSLLIENGFTRSQSVEIRRIAKLPETKFNKFADSEKPPSPSYLTSTLIRPNPAWATVAHGFSILLSKARKARPKELAESLSDKEINTMRGYFRDLRVWMQEVERAIESRKPPVSSKSNSQQEKS